MQDLKIAIRLLRKDRGFAAAVLLTLGLCIAGNVAIFSIVHAVLIEPLPVPEPDRLVWMMNAYPNALPGEGRVATTAPDYFDRLRDVDLFEEQALFQGRDFTIGSQGVPEQHSGVAVTPSYFRLVGIEPQLGRVFAEEEGEIGKEHKAVLSHALWQQLFGGDVEIVGRDLRLDGTPHEIVGVMPADFQFLGDWVEFWVPLVFTAEETADTARHLTNSYNMLGRLRPGASVTQAQAQIDVLNARNLERFPEYKDRVLASGFHTLVLPLHAEIVRDVRAVLYLLWGASIFVLLLGCVNVASLTAIRASVRAKDLAMRQALGAGRWRLARQLVTEGLLLSALGGVAGLFVGGGVLVLFAGLGVDQLPRGSEIGLDVTVVAITLAATLVIGLFLGLFPVASRRGLDLHSTLRQEGRGGTSGRATQRVRNALVAAQVAIAVVLLTGAFLLVVSFQGLLAIDPGFRTDRLMTASVGLPAHRYPGPEERLAFAQRSLARFSSLPGVVGAGVTNGLPFYGCCGTQPVHPTGYERRPGEAMGAPFQAIVDASYFETLEIPLLEGRFFDQRDTKESRPVVIIDDRLARRFWPNESPLEKTLHIGPYEITDDTVVLTIVGVVAEHTMRNLGEAADQMGACFRSSIQVPPAFLSFAVRTEIEPDVIVGALRAELAALDPELPLLDPATMDERIRRTTTSRRIPMVLATVFALMALFLAAIGIYGMMAYRVTQRTKEFGIRIALGSTKRQLFVLILREGLVVLAWGLGLGVGASFLLRNVIASQLHGVEPTNPVVLVSVVMVLVVVALLACAVPARRATRVDPSLTLNYD